MTCCQTGRGCCIGVGGRVGSCHGCDSLTCQLLCNLKQKSQNGLKMLTMMMNSSVPLTLPLEMAEVPTESKTSSRAVFHFLHLTRVTSKVRSMLATMS